MNTPTPTPRTDAATYPADCLGTTLVTNRDCSRALERELVTLTGAYTYTCTHHNDQQRAACPVCLVASLTAERDELRAESAAEREKVRVLRAALENLRDEQNGAPLCTREEQWTQAMDKADAAIAATEGAK
jgi:hypothetical protein